MKSMSKRLAALLAALALLACCAVPAFALGQIDLDRTGYIQVTLRDSDTEAAVSGGELTLYQVAKVKQEKGDLSFAYTNGFEDCKIELGDLSESDLAKKLAGQITSTMTSTTVTVGENGVARFDDLKPGLYLIVQKTAAKDYSAINPFLVTLPMQENDTYVYEVDAMPKVGTVTYRTPDTPPPIPVVPDTPDTPVSPDTPDTPDVPTPPNPDSPDVFVLDAHTDTETPAVPTADTPDVYVMDAHVLPQTGQLNWPIPVLAAAGVVLIGVGLKLRKGSRRNEK